MSSLPLLKFFLVVLTPLNFLFTQWKKLISLLFHSSDDNAITEEELEDCRLSLLSGMAGIEDSLGGIETWYYMEVLRGGAVQTPDEARAALRAVTREDVRAILRQLTLSVSYLLTREEGPAYV